MKNINTAKIIYNLQNEIAEKKLVATTVHFANTEKKGPNKYDEQKLNEALSGVHNNCHIDVFSKMSGGKCQVLIKRIIRFFVRSTFLEQLCQQYCFNVNASKSLEQLERHTTELEARIAELEKRVR